MSSVKHFFVTALLGAVAVSWLCDGTRISIISDAWEALQTESPDVDMGLWHARDQLRDANKWSESLKQCRVSVGSSQLGLTRYLGGGSYGSVFSLGANQYAVKFFKNKADAADERRVLKAVSEGKAGASPNLNHLVPNTPETCCGVPCVVIGFVRGQTLQSWLKSVWPDKVFAEPWQAPWLPENLVKSVICQALSARAAFESAGYYNHDTHFNNVMIDDSGRVTFIDFGTAQPRTHWRRSSWVKLNFDNVNSWPLSVFGGFVNTLEDNANFAAFSKRILTYATANQAISFEMDGAGEEQSGPEVRLCPMKRSRKTGKMALDEDATEPLMRATRQDIVDGNVDGKGEETARQVWDFFALSETPNKHSVDPEDDDTFCSRLRKLSESEQYLQRRDCQPVPLPSTGEKVKKEDSSDPDKPEEMSLLSTGAKVKKKVF